MPPPTGVQRFSRSWQVVLLWEAFLLQMNEFDRYLEFKLRDMLDPVVETKPPARHVEGGRKPAIELAGDTAPAVEPLAVPLPVAPLRNL
jgi:hypothetical protein